MKFKIYNILLFIIFLVSIGCEDPLQEETYSQLGPENFLQTETDAIALLNSAYDVENADNGRGVWMLKELPTDLLIVTGGGLGGQAQPIQDFTWDASHNFLDAAFNRPYTIISRTNLFLEEVPSLDVNEDRKRVLLAEARFLRAINYTYLYDFFGPTPLITTSDVSPQDRPARADESEIIEFVENELLAASEDLPVTASEYGRATWGAALGMLSRFHLNNKDWEKAAEVSKIIIDSEVYSLFEGEHRMDLFALENEKNSEFIYVRPHIAVAGHSWQLLPRVAPPNYQFQSPPKENFAVQYRTLSNFLNSFHPDDQRKDAIITEYVNTSGDTVQLGEDDARSFKYPEDLSATGRHMGNDDVALRYADILLHRSEALNEIHGPNEESVELINMVREKAGVPLYNIGDFSSKAAFRDIILAERGWEFFSEALRRQDLVRHDKFLEYANERGKTTFDFHVRYPIPQAQVDRNPNLEQNEGY